MSRTRTAATQFATALDDEDYSGLAKLLAEECQYLTANGALLGPQAIIASYRDAGTWAKSSIQNVRYESHVRIDHEDNAIVTFIDHLEHNGFNHTYACEQAVFVDAQGRVCRIVHHELPGRREAADAFFRSVGVDRNS